MVVAPPRTPRFLHPADNTRAMSPGRPPKVTLLRPIGQSVRSAPQWGSAVVGCLPVPFLSRITLGEEEANGPQSTRKLECDKGHRQGNECMTPVLPARLGCKWRCYVGACNEKEVLALGRLATAAARSSPPPTRAGPSLGEMGAGGGCVWWMPAVVIIENRALSVSLSKSLAALAARESLPSKSTVAAAPGTRAPHCSLRAPQRRRHPSNMAVSVSFIPAPPTASLVAWSPGLRPHPPRLLREAHHRAMPGPAWPGGEARGGGESAAW